MRRAGVDYFRMMAITGHRTMEVFKRYDTIDQDDHYRVVHQLDTYMDIMPASPTETIRNPLNN
jgi:hypothetical protein